MAPVTAPVLEIRNLGVALSRRRHTTPVVRGIFLSLAPGERVALVGESGSGKSMTALAIMGLLPRAAHRTEGAILLNGRDLGGLPERAMRAVRGRDIGMIFQDPLSSLNPVQTVGRQIAEAIRLHDPVDRATARRRAAALLDRVHIPRAASRLDDYPHEFSGGMRQRVMIAMALANAPAMVIADEPTTALDVTTQAQVLLVLDEVCRDKDAAVLLITHDLGVVGTFCDRIIVLYAGRIVEQGPTDALFTRPRHPYTAGLLAAMPPLEADPETLPAIRGEPPDFWHLPQGCAFAPRCPLATERCRTDPELLDRGQGRLSACHHADRVADLAGPA